MNSIWEAIENHKVEMHKAKSDLKKKKREIDSETERKLKRTVEARIAAVEKMADKTCFSKKSQFDKQ